MSEKIQRATNPLKIYMSHKAEFWTGVVTMLVIFFISGFTIINKIQEYNRARLKQQAKKIVSPIPETTITITVSPSITPSQISRQIKKLADTGNAVIEARTNDTFWSISVKMCGDGRYYQTMEKMNNYQGRYLHEGDSITIYCY